MELWVPFYACGVRCLVPSYAMLLPAMRCPVLRSAMLLPGYTAVSFTTLGYCIAYHPTRALCDFRYWRRLSGYLSTGHEVLVVPGYARAVLIPGYAVSGTEIRYAGPRLALASYLASAHARAGPLLFMPVLLPFMPISLPIMP
eukprot:3503734-Rhodomonas_salina.5